MRTREPRHKVLVRARLRDGPTWQDVTIQNVSSRGMLVRATQAAPIRGSYVEVRRLDQVIVARIVWQRGTLFGCRTQDRIDVGRLTAAANGGAERPKVANDPQPPERRRPPRPAAEMAERNALIGRAMQWIAIVAGIACAALVLGLTLWETLASPMEDIGDALGRTPQR